MTDINFCVKKDSLDVWNSYLLKDAEFEGIDEFPKIKSSLEIPKKLISFSKAIKSKEFDAYVMFYEHDKYFERLWKNPIRYTKILQKFKGVITPDFSMYVNMPLCMQKYQMMKGRMLGNFWSKLGMNIIPNVRFGDERTYEFAFLGIEKEKNVAIGTIGMMKNKKERKIILSGISRMIKKLKPKNIIIYGSLPKEFVLKHKDTNFIIFKNSTYDYLKK